MIIKTFKNVRHSRKYWKRDTKPPNRGKDNNVNYKQIKKITFFFIHSPFFKVWIYVFKFLSPESLLRCQVSQYLCIQWYKIHTHCFKNPQFCCYLDIFVTRCQHNNVYMFGRLKEEYIIKVYSEIIINNKKVNLLS